MAIRVSIPTAGAIRSHAATERIDGIKPPIRTRIISLIRVARAHLGACESNGSGSNSAFNEKGSVLALIRTDRRTTILPFVVHVRM